MSSKTTGSIIWFTGLPCAGKSTLSLLLAEELRARNMKAAILDGDDIRRMLGGGLAFTKADRLQQAAMVGRVARLLASEGVTAIVATISPYAEARQSERLLAERECIPFIEVYTNATLETVMQRDVKGMYAKAQKGEIQNFTGISDPYEAPTAPDVEVCTDTERPKMSMFKILDFLRSQGLATYEL